MAGLIIEAIIKEISASSATIAFADGQLLEVQRAVIPETLGLGNRIYLWFGDRPAGGQHPRAILEYLVHPASE